MKVFISHSFDDEDLALQLQEILHEKGLTAFMAQQKPLYDLSVGEKIRKEIDSSNHVVGIITQVSFASYSVNQELGYAQGIGLQPITMLEKNDPKIGALTSEFEREYFDKHDFKKSCYRVRDFILDTSPKITKNNNNLDWLIPNVYEPIYNKLMIFLEQYNNIHEIPPDPWKDLKPLDKLKIESELATTLKNYSNELDHWKNMFVDVKDGFEFNKRELGEILYPAFEKSGMITSDNMIVLTKSSRQEPMHWINAFKFILFDDTIQDPNTLYVKLLKYSQDTNNGMKESLEYWHRFFPNVFTNVLQTLPKLQKHLQLEISHSQLIDQREYLRGLLNNIVKYLETKFV